ncbi:GNAT family N-acetyltransferase [Pseudomonas moorei]|jgi:predicted acetyltransferase|uniref:Predicted acetyltransferase n=1 Tax=Pseudomonas moorei TaxID=395599 RepID=A0A1H1DUJ6_9PSED|nr:GNAT family N-acetyltransferase [Pseudomonas moorei]KAB0504001.1 GNAT family N-acetyltransferase [Pseudomonas moorei]PPA03783.1 GNAT family N-acetyltransferase [Pseudomonas sp. MWU12-2312b]PTT87752.1 GNAT family N-acetyltransferase [Pseudomonas sp. HMWF031]SDQ80154.1 Predicted acetyltransferase [Pseudomonas moorei]
MSSIALHAAQRDDLETIECLMQFYTYDFSEWMPLKLAEHGLFNILPLTDYWRKPSTRAFLIRVDGELAGFVTVDDETHLPGAEHNIGYLFVARRFRGRGVAKFVVSTLLSRFPGQWQIFHIEVNQPARLFWAAVMPDLVAEGFTRHSLTVKGYPCTFYRFEALLPSS